MATFIYQAKAGPQKIVEGLLEAESRQGALDKISKMGYFPVRVDESGEEKERQSSLPFMRRVGIMDLSLFTRQLSDLLESGVPLMKALRVVEDQTENKKLSQIIREIRAQVKDGKSLSDGMKSYPDVFSNVYTSLIRAGEVGGILGSTLSRLSEFAEGEDELRSKVIAAMAYPALISIVGVGTVLFLVAFIVPRLAGMFADMGQSLPWMTVLLTRASGLLTRYWWAGILLAGGGIAALSAGSRKEKGRLFLDKAVLRMPLWGTVIKKVAIARFARTLGMLLTGGVPILDALKVVTGALNHAVLEEQLGNAAQSVQHGASLSESLKGMPDFPAFICNMIAVGEEGNLLEKALFKVAVTYERQADRAVKMMTSLLEPLMILAVGSVIGFIVIAMLLPIFQIHSFMK